MNVPESTRGGQIEAWAAAASLLHGGLVSGTRRQRHGACRWRTATASPAVGPACLLRLLRASAAARGPLLALWQLHGGSGTRRGCDAVSCIADASGRCWSRGCGPQNFARVSVAAAVESRGGHLQLVQCVLGGGSLRGMTERARWHACSLNGHVLWPGQHEVCSHPRAPTVDRLAPLTVRLWESALSEARWSRGEDRPAGGPVRGRQGPVSPRLRGECSLLVRACTDCSGGGPGFGQEVRWNVQGEHGPGMA